jgi:hypothetical protein
MSGPLCNGSDIMARRGTPWQEGRVGAGEKGASSGESGTKTV